MTQTALITSSRENLVGADECPVLLIHATPKAPRGVAVLLPAMGVPASYYAKAAERLAHNGIAASVLEARGQGDSPIEIARAVDFGYGHLLSDLNVTLEMLRERYPGMPLALLGHSLGGHLSMMQLALHPRSVDAVALITTAAPHPDGYRGIARFRVWLGTRLARVLSLLLGYYPGHRMGFGGIQPNQLIREWAAMGRTANYHLESSSVDVEAALKTVDAPILVLPIKGDELAPRAACEAIAAKVPRASVEWAEVGAPELSDRGTHHQRWAREPNPIVDAICEFFERRVIRRRGEPMKVSAHSS